MRHDFEAFIHSLELRHFEPWEFLVGMERGNYPPPQYLWPNVALTAVLLDNLRHHFRRRTTITSAYRAPAYNHLEGGVKLSQHQAFSALDFKVRYTPTWEVAKWLRAQRGELVRLPIQARRVQYISPAGPVPFAELETWDRVRGEASLVRAKIAIGVYDTFCHVDTRGENRSWSGSG